MSSIDRDLFSPGEESLFSPAITPSAMFEAAPAVIPAPPVEAPEKVAAAAERMRTFTSDLTVDTHGITRLIGHPYIQYPDTPSCFWSGVQLAMYARTGSFPDERKLTAPARERGLMNAAGAVTETEEHRLAIERLIKDVHGLDARFNRPRAVEHRGRSNEQQIQEIVVGRRNLAMVLYHLYWGQGGGPVGEWEAVFVMEKLANGDTEYISNYSPKGLTGKRNIDTFAALLRSTHNSYFPMLCEIEVTTPLLPRGFEPA